MPAAFQSLSSGFDNPTTALQFDSKYQAVTHIVNPTLTGMNE